MTKDELINLKKSLAIEIRDGIYYQAQIDLGQFVGSEKTDRLLGGDIKEQSDVAGAIKEIDDTLTKIIFKAAKLGIDIASLKVLIKYGYFVNTSHWDMKEKFNEDRPIYLLGIEDVMPNYLAIITSFLIDAYSVHYFDVDLLKTTGNLFIVNYDEFISKLIEHGYLENKINFKEFFNSNKDLSFQIDFEPALKKIRKY